MILFNNKKKVIALSLLLSCPIAWAGNFYAGMQGGFEMLQMQKNVTKSTNGGAPTFSSPEASALGGVVDGYVGVEQQARPGMRFAVEFDIAGYLGKTKTSYTDGGLNNSLREHVDYNAGVSLIPEFQLTPSVTLYPRFGVGFGKISSQSSGSDDGYVGGLGYAGKFTKDTDFSYRLGLGMDARVSPNLSVRLEYDYLHFSPFTMDSASHIPNYPHITVETSTRYQPVVNTVSLGLTYHFGKQPPVVASAA